MKTALCTRCGIFVKQTIIVDDSVFLSEDEKIIKAIIE